MKNQDQQRKRARLAWFVGAPVGGLVLGIWIASIPLSVAEEDYRQDASTRIYNSVATDPPTVTERETTTVVEEVAAPGLPPGRPESPAGNQPGPGARSDAAVIREICEENFPDASQADRRQDCVAALSD